MSARSGCRPAGLCRRRQESLPCDSGCDLHLVSGGKGTTIMPAPDITRFCEQAELEKTQETPFGKLPHAPQRLRTALVHGVAVPGAAKGRARHFAVYLAPAAGSSALVRPEPMRRTRRLGRRLCGMGALSGGRKSRKAAVRAACGSRRGKSQGGPGCSGLADRNLCAAHAGNGSDRRCHRNFDSGYRVFSRGTAAGRGAGRCGRQSRIRRQRR